MDLQTLSVDDVFTIHEILVEEFRDSEDPIEPPGVRSVDLLESAVNRQWSGYAGHLKYSDPIDNAATLLFGVCCDHPFHNGNKRTALVSMLAHLDKNKRTLFETRRDDLYRLMLNVASGRASNPSDKRRRKRGKDLSREEADKEVAAIATWIRNRCSKITRGERSITYRELRKILESFGFAFENPKNNYIDIVRYETVKTGVLRRKTATKRRRIGNIGWPGENRQVSVSGIKHIREMCNLTEANGVDSDAFYNFTTIVDSFVNRYRTILRRLGKT